MKNIDRLTMEIQGVTLKEEELTIYLSENNLSSQEEYNPESNQNKRSIYKAALSILESLANNPTNMKYYKQDDMTVSQFAENLQARIDQLERKIRQMPSNSHGEDTSFFNLFSF